MDIDISVNKHILKFEGIGCGACKAMEPTWNKLKEKNPSVDFQKVKVEENPKIVERYSVIALPTFIAVSEGDELERVIGVCSENTLQNIINLLV
jgi:thioredoxin 1